MKDQTKNIPSGWKETTLGEVASTVTDYVANGSFASLKENVVYKRSKDFAALIRLADHNNGYSNLVFVDKNSYDFLKKSSLKYKDIIISNVGEYSGTVFRVPNLNMPMTLGPNSVLVRFDGCNDFFYYYLSSVYGQSLLNSIKSGSANPKFNKTDLKKLEFVIPEREAEQRAIAAVLSSLDDKIELLRSQNKTLENIAQLLFKRWFVGFEFPDKNGKPYKSSGGKMIDSELGKIPEGWRVGRLTEIFDFLEGPGIRNWQYTETGRKFINIRLIQDGDIEIEHASHISSEEAERTYKHFHLQERDMVVSTSGTLGRSAIVRKEHLPLMLNTSVIRFRPIDKLSYGFMYQFLNSPFFKNELISMASGSVQSNFGPIHLKQIEMIIPGTTILKMYAIAANSLYDKINANLSHVKILSCFRDTILPKLMKGEVRVREHD